MMGVGSELVAPNLCEGQELSGDVLNKVFTAVCMVSVYNTLDQQNLHLLLNILTKSNFAQLKTNCEE